MPKTFSTINDVAKACGVSRAQVSRALRGDACVRPETRALVEKAAAHLDYRPNLAARSLVSAQSSIVGLIVGDLDNPFHIQLAKAVERELLAAGFDPVTALTSMDDASGQQEADRLLRLRAAGVIMLATPHSARAIGEIAQRLPCVYIGSKRINHPRVTEIAVDDESAVRMAMDYLFSLGHTKIAHLGGGSEASAKQRTRTYCKIMDEAGLKPLYLKGTHDAASGRHGVDVLFSGHHHPTAIFASNDYLALGVLDRLKGMGLSVPGDVSVIGFDDIPAAANEVFSLSTLRQDTAEQASIAVKSLQKLISENGKSPRRKVVSVELVLRKSCAAPVGC